MNTTNISSQSTITSRSLKDVMRHYPLFFYFFLAYAISWVLFIPYVLAEWGILHGNYTIFYVLHTFGPALSAVIMAYIIAGKQACKICVSASGSGAHPGNGTCSSSWAFQR
jgi:hypothetical protein